MRYYIADCHFKHEALNTRMDCRGFADGTAMDSYMIAQWNKRVRKNDEVVILGDLVFSRDPEEAEGILKQLKGKKYLITGNHDAWVHKKTFDRTLLKDIADYREFHDNGRKVICCHYPILCYNGQYKLNRNGGSRTFMVYGHVHDTEDQRNVLEFASIMRKRSVDRQHDGHPAGLECNMLNCFCMYSDYTPWTLDEWISYYGLKTAAGSESVSARSD